VVAVATAAGSCPGARRQRFDPGFRWWSCRPRTCEKVPTGSARGLTCSTCRTIVVKKDKCLVIYRFSRGRLQSVARGLQRPASGSPPRRAVVSCAETECAGQFFRIWPDATISIARITDSDAASGGNGALRHRNFAQSYRLVTAGDGRWTLGHPYGDIYVKLLRGTKARQHTTRGSLHRSRRRGRTNVRTHSRGRAATDPGRGRHDVPCRSEDGHALGEGREADVDPYARGAPALPGD
jgi:hypothetical protein